MEHSYPLLRTMPLNQDPNIMRLELVIAYVFVILCSLSFGCSAFFISASFGDKEKKMMKDVPTFVGCVLGIYVVLVLPYFLTLLVGFGRVLGNFMQRIRLQHEIRSQLITICVQCTAYCLYEGKWPDLFGPTSLLHGALFFAALFCHTDEGTAVCRTINVLCGLASFRRYYMGGSFWEILLVGSPCFVSIMIQKYMWFSLYQFIRQGYDGL